MYAGVGKEDSQIRTQPVDLCSHQHIGLVVPFTVHLPSDLSQSGQRVVLFGYRVVVICL